MVLISSVTPGQIRPQSCFHGIEGMPLPRKSWVFMKPSILKEKCGNQRGLWRESQLILNQMDPRRGQETKERNIGHHRCFNLSSPGQSSIGKRWDGYDKGKAKIGGIFKTCTFFGTLREKITMWCGLKILSAKFPRPVLAALLAGTSGLQFHWC